MANYLNNNALMEEIHKSKLTFCDVFYQPWEEIRHLIDPETLGPNFNAQDPQHRALAMKRRFGSYDVIVYDLADLQDPDPNPHTVYRLMTDSHIPEDFPNRKLNFPPFRHYIYSNGEFVEVLRSHSRGEEFAADHGKVTEKLGRMYMMLAERYSRKSNWRGYSYRDEFIAAALLQLCTYGLKFNEAKSSNAFAYLSQITSNAFIRFENIETRHRDIRDDLLEAVGQTGSINRQIRNEFREE